MVMSTMNKNQTSTMKLKESYKSPELFSIDLKSEGIICSSTYMEFGSDNASGFIGDENLFDGGEF